MVHSFKRTLLAGALALGLAGPAAAQYSGIYFLGDSLTDAGSFRPVLPPGTGLFTTNPGPVYATVVGNDLGFTVTPGNQGGNDFAQGGARVSQTPGFPPNTPPASGAIPLTAQLNALLARGPVDPNALYFVWGGANDLFTQLTLAGSGAITPAQLQANVATSATDLAGTIARLQAAGARYIVILNVPDIGSTPFGRASGQSASITSLSSFYNSTLFSALNAAGVQGLRLNAFGLLNEIAANPSAYGFVNSTLPACGSTSSLICTAANFVAPNAAQTFVFADSVHPTTAGHALLAQYIEAALVAPQQIAALAEAPIASEAARFRSLDARMSSAINAPGKSRLEAWVTYDYANPDFNSGFLSGDGKLDTLSVGLDMKVTNSVLVGAAFGYTQNKSDIGQAAFKLNETSGTLYGGWGQGPWYVGATLGASDLDYKDVHRDIALGAATRTETGTTRGYATTARALAGYWFGLNTPVVHGPFARYTYEDIKVRAYSEQGNASTTMSFDQQHRKSGIVSLGWQVAGTFGTVRPFARASWEIETKDNERTVGASVYGMGGGFSVPAYRPDSNYALLGLGLAADIGRVTAFVSGETTASKSDGNSKGITVGVRIPL